MVIALIQKPLVNLNSPLEERRTNPQPSQPVGAISHTRVPTSGLDKPSPLVLSRAQVQRGSFGHCSSTDKQCADLYMIY